MQTLSHNNCLIKLIGMLIQHDISQSSESEREPFKLESLLHKLAIKTLRSVQNILNQQFALTLQKKYEQLVSKDENIVEFLQYLIYSLLSQIDRLQQSVNIEVEEEDYRVLEDAVQKSQAEIRKHIRIEQQLKIYLDSLEQKSQEMQKKLQVEQLKYSQLFECMKESEEERKDLLRKLARVQQGKVSKLQSRQKSKSNSNYSTINQQFYKQYLGVRKTKVNKGKHIIDKLNDRGRKLSDKKSHGNLNIIDGAIEINLANNIVISKKNSYDQHLIKNQPSHDASIRQLTKTVQMKQPSVGAIERRPNRKVSKYKTESGEQAEKRECRSNSMCN